MENKNDMMFERLGDLRPHKSRLNLDSFTNFSDPEKEKNLELKKQLLLKKIDILKSLGGEEKELDETFSSLAEVFGVEKDILIKAHSSFPIGTIHNGYKKIAEGYWRKVSQYGLTKKDHERLGRGEDIVGISYPKWIKREELERQKRVHQKEAEKLNNKNYSDEDVIKKEKEEKKKSLPEKGTPEWHELQIAKKTMKMNDVGAMIMGGQTKEEARKILKEYGLEKSNEDDLEKGLINDLSYSWNSKEGGLSFNKTGKEIKAQLPALITTLKQQYDALVIKQAALAEEIGEEPTEERTYFERNFSFKSYPNEVVYENSNPNGRTEEQKLMQCYNDNLYKLCDIQRDIKVGEAMERNLDDKKKYSLSLSQAADLGF